MPSENVERMKKILGEALLREALAQPEGTLFAAIPEADGYAVYAVRSDGQWKGLEYAPENNGSIEGISLAHMAAILENHMPKDEFFLQIFPKEQLEDWLSQVSARKAKP